MPQKSVDKVGEHDQPFSPPRKVLYEESQAVKEAAAEPATPSRAKNKQGRIDDAFTSITLYDKTSARHKELTDTVTFMIVKDMVPIYTEEKERFTRLVRELIYI